VILQGGYGGYRAPHQFPEFRKTFPAKEQVFGVRDDKVPQTPYGYISRYAMTNAQEGFAEHFRAYLTERDAFRTKAETEQADGHPELMQKYRYMERLIEKTPTTMRRLSPEFLALDARWNETRARVTRLLEVRRLLGAKAPKALAALLESQLATAFTEETKRSASAEAALRRKVTSALRRLPDREKADRALAAILGMTLEIKAARGATTARPVFTATVRGAHEEAVTGTLRFETRVPGRFGRAPPATEFELSRGGTRQVSWEPDTGDDLSAFVAVASAEFAWGGRTFRLEREVSVRPSIPMWNVIGPFDNPGGAPADLEHPPETKVDLSAEYPGATGATIGWKRIRRPADATLAAEFAPDLAKLLGSRENVAAYAVVWAHVPRVTDARLAVGSADGAVAWVNGKRVLAWLEGRRDYRSKANGAPIRLKKGANAILIKVTLTAKSWRFGAHLTAADGGPIAGLRYSLDQTK